MICSERGKNISIKHLEYSKQLQRDRMPVACTVPGQDLFIHKSYGRPTIPSHLSFLLCSVMEGSQQTKQIAVE